MRACARNKGSRERVAPDFLIGAHALQQCDVLLTTHGGFFRRHFKGLVVVTPPAAP
jgi:predicted nucleic acid-binding protein